MAIELPVPSVKLQHPWTLYAKQLFPQGYGYPLWQPDPDPTAAREVDIGDVGWMAYGGFCQLFNARREDREKQVHADLPEDFVPFDPLNLVILGPAESVTAIPPLCSQTIETFDASGSAQANSGPIGLASAGASFSFKCTDNQGAVLMFSPAAYLTEIMSKHHVIGYMREHFPRWMEFSDKYGLGLKDHELFFVCGMTKTARWAVAAFQGDFRRKEGTFFADLGSAGGLNMSVSISNRSLPQTHRKVGPRRPAAANIPLVGTANSESATTDEEPNDQCIFIHYYQMKRRMGFFCTFRAAAGPDELPPPGTDEAELGVLAEGDSDTDDNDEFEQTMDPTEETYNPVNHLLDYILENSDASVAIASDLDLYALFKDQQFPADVPTALASLKPTVEVDESGAGTVATQIDFGAGTVAEGVSQNAQLEGTVDPANPLALPEDKPVQEPDYDFPGYLRESFANVFPGTLFNDYADDREDDDGSESDKSEGLVEISADDFPGYFQERNGRLFHAHARSPYPLPVDVEEHQRQNGLNQLLRRLIGDFSVGPWRELLVTAPGEQRRVLDLGTGTGEWVLDMAREFPCVRFYGVDIVPIATCYPPRNVLFEMQDIGDYFRYDTSSIDLVHARCINMAIRDYGALLPEIARLLRQDGLFVSNEWGHCPIMLDGSDLALHAPSTSEFFKAVCETLREHRGIPTIAHKIPELLEDSGFFTNIVSRRYYMPIGSWHDDPALRELGREYRDMVELYARAMRAVLNEGRWAAQADALINGCINESWRVPGLVSVYYTVHARRV